MQFKNFTLDQFQIDAIDSIEKNHSVIVSAATGTGKTLIADYVITKYLPQDKKIIYTAPIKALSNQKYKDFKTAFGAEMVGMLTGDVVINDRAPLLIMTTEIFRNMLLAKDPQIEDVTYVVFDEIHFLSDIERGTVWEESLIFAPEHIRFIGLSATIPNAEEFADWIHSIKKHPVDVVKYEKRAVPLEHFVYDKMLGITTLAELKENMKIPEESIFRVRRGRGREHGRAQGLDPKIHLDLIRDIKDKLPAIFFYFSRKDCEFHARELAQRFDFTSPEQKSEIISFVRGRIPEELRNLDSVRRIREVLPRGIAYHHAGLLPILKDIVEDLFAKGLIKVLYATETFAVGINMPAKSVCFGGLEKFDGFSFRYLNSKEYFQLAGRAGRRGIDTVGHVFAIVDRHYTDFEKVEHFTAKDVEPIISQFKLTYNTVLHLINAHTAEQREVILKSNFDYFLKKKESPSIRIMSTFYNRLDALQKLGYVTKNLELTLKGLFSLHIYYEELLISEIFSTELYKNFSVDELLVVVAAIIYEPKNSDYFSTKKVKQTYQELIKKLETNQYVAKKIDRRSLMKLIRFVLHWADGGSFEDLLELCNYEEGDIIRVFRRMIDIMKQIKRATKDRNLSDKIDYAINKIDRDVVRVEM
jgi:superfamily II RNA helicase